MSNVMMPLPPDAFLILAYKAVWTPCPYHIVTGKVRSDMAISWLCVLENTKWTASKQWHDTGSKVRVSSSKKLKSSTARFNTEDKTIKRRHITVRDKHLSCSNEDISFSGRQTVTIERLDEHLHDHDIEESFRIKKLTILPNFLKAEAAKNYAASNIPCISWSRYIGRFKTSGANWWCIFKEVSKTPVQCDASESPTI